MNFKKLLSIVLALTIVLSFAMTGFAADTKLYLDYDFAQHVADQSASTGSTATFISDSMTSVANKAELPAIRSAAAAEGKIPNVGLVNGHSAKRTDFVKNSNGDWMFRLISETADVAPGQSYFFVPDEMWVMVDGETCIVSYDTMLTPYEGATAFTNGVTNGDIYHPAIYWQNADGTKTFDAPNLSFSAVDNGGTLDYRVEFVGGYSNNSAYSITPNVAHRTAFGFKKYTDNGGAEGAARTFAERQYALDGELKWTVNKNDANGVFSYIGDNGKYGGTVGLDHVDRIGAIRLTSARYNLFNAKTGVAYGKVRMYSVKDDSFRLSSNVLGVAPVKTEKVIVKFGNPVAAATFATSKITVEKDGVALDPSEYTVSNFKEFVKSGTEVYSTVDVNFANELELDATYTIKADAAIANEMGTTLGENNTVSFATEKLPIILSAYKVNGVAGGSFTVDSTKLQSASLKVENTTGANKAVSVIYAVYTSAGQLKDVVFSNDTVAANYTAEVGAGVVLSEEGYVKTFVWDSINSLKPWGGIYKTDIAAAQ